MPFARRSSWHREWEAELWVLRSKGRGGPTLVRFALGGLAHALWERREEEGMMTHGLAQDVRLALRRIVRAPGFAFVTVGVLALGIGANTALFGALSSVLLQEPPYPSADRLVTVDLLFGSDPDTPLDTIAWSYPKFELGRERMPFLAALAGYSPSTLTLTGVGSASRLSVEYVTPAYFPLLGAGPALGRFFTPDEEAPADAPVIVLSHDLWVSRFGADPAVVGRVLTLNGTSLEVVGVAESGFRGLTGSAEAWVPVAAITAISGPRRLRLAWAHWLHGIGALRPGVTLEQAWEQARTAGLAVDEAFPDPSGAGRQDVALVPYLAARVNPVARTSVAAVSAAALLFLLIACGSVASLLLARASARRTDVAVRAALGAGRGRLVREHLVESLLLAGAGGALGIVLALSGQRLVAAAVRYALDTSGTRGLQFVDPEGMGLGVGALALGLGCALVTGIVFGGGPALVASRAHPGDSLRAAGAVGRRGRGNDAGRSVLVGVQLAMTVVLLAGAALMGVSFARLADVDPGFAHADVLTLAYDRGPGHSDAEEHAFMADLIGRLATLPGVVDAAASTCPPLAGLCEIVGVRQVDDAGPDERGDPMPVIAYPATERYFETIGVPLLEGRAFGPDAADGPPILVLSASAAAQLFAGESALGHRIAITHSLTESEMATVVGVVGDVRYAALEQEPMPTVYLSEHQAPLPYGTLFVRTAGDPTIVVDAVRAVVDGLDPNLPLYQIGTLAERIAGATARTRIILGLLVSFGLSGLLIGALGLYGLVAHSVERRTSEVGLRIALGADRAGVLRLMVRRPAAIAVGAAVLGGLVASFLTRYLESVAYGSPAPGPLVVGGAALVLVGVAGLASWLPARRATRIAPTQALRAD